MSQVYIRKYLGSFSLGADEKEWTVEILLPDNAPKRVLSELWPEDKEPDIEGKTPTEVVEMIKNQLERYWIHTGREEKLKLIQWCVVNGPQLDLDWAEGQIAELQEKITKQIKEIVSLRDYLHPPFSGNQDERRRQFLDKPFGPSEWLELLMACQNGECTCMYVMEKIQAELDRVSVDPQTIQDAERFRFLIKRGLAWRDCYKDGWRPGEWLYAEQDARYFVDGAMKEKTQ